MYIVCQIHCLNLNILDILKLDSITLYIFHFLTFRCILSRRTDWQNLPLQQQNVIYELVQALATIGIVSLGIWFSSNIML